MYASNSHSYTHLILALGIVRKPTVWGFITSKYPGIHDIGLATEGLACTVGRLALEPRGGGGLNELHDARLVEHMLAPRHLRARVKKEQTLNKLHIVYLASKELKSTKHY